MVDPSPARPSFRALVFSDLQRFRGGRPGWLKLLGRCAVEPGLLGCVILRAQQCAMPKGRRRRAGVLRTLGVVLVGADFVPGAQVGPGLYLPHPVGVTLGNHVVMGSYVTLGQGVTLGARSTDTSVEQLFPVVEDGAILLTKSTIAGPVRIGAHAQVAAHALVLDDVAPMAIVGGVPARVIGDREDEARRSGLVPPEARPPASGS